jgi:hypothetical protein
MVQFWRGLWFVFMSSLLVHAPAEAAAEWVALEARYQSHPLQKVYIDLNTIHREGNIVTLSAMIDWKTMQGGRSPTRFYSSILTKQFDCVARRFLTVTSTEFYGHMGTGEIIGGGSYTSEGLWVAIDPGTINQGLWKRVCEKDQG